MRGIAHHRFGYSLTETRAELRERLGQHDPHPGYAVPFRERLCLPGGEWMNLGRAITLAAVLTQKGVEPMGD